MGMEFKATGGNKLVRRTESLKFGCNELIN